ncbi:hypothetical protein HZA33_02720 [Candidatus Pacearchaeota archaeon]|nr:hypothetical protein [Candidatus Pacearchaeota archaeon]
MEYYISISKDELKHHKEYLRLTDLGEPVIWEKRHKYPASIFMGGDNNRLYFLARSSELEEVIEELIKDLPESSSLMVQKATKENMPQNLREGYERFFKEITKRDS